jgi:hypothetical protein
LLKNISDFWKLIACPDAASYTCNISFIFVTSRILALQNKKQSSANNKCVTSGAPRHTFTP